MGETVQPDALAPQHLGAWRCCHFHSHREEPHQLNLRAELSTALGKVALLYVNINELVISFLRIVSEESLLINIGGFEVFIYLCVPRTHPVRMLGSDYVLALPP